MENLTIRNLNNPAFLEAQGLSKVWKAYAENSSKEEIIEVGFNENSGYVYIALENGISISSFLGRDVEFLTTDYETGEETFSDSYEGAMRLTEEG